MHVSVLVEEALVFEGFDIAEYDKRVFGMYSGELVQANLRFDVSLVNLVLDKFGVDIVMIPAGNDCFEITVDVSVSPVFLSWISQFGKSAAIKGPEKLVDAMLQYLNENLEIYLPK